MSEIIQEVDWFHWVVFDVKSALGCDKGKEKASHVRVHYITDPVIQSDLQ